MIKFIDKAQFYITILITAVTIKTINNIKYIIILPHISDKVLDIYNITSFKKLIFTTNDRSDHWIFKVILRFTI